ncbi:MAG: hypothetical protein M9884_13435 [Rhodocyclaceae bacterium]|nr:hypothetical protein [Rhodocyclaceae bacterium]
MVALLLAGKPAVPIFGTSGFAAATTEAKSGAALLMMVPTEPDGGRLLGASASRNVGTFCYMIAVGPGQQGAQIRQAFKEENPPPRRAGPDAGRDADFRRAGGKRSHVSRKRRSTGRIEDTTEKTALQRLFPALTDVCCALIAALSTKASGLQLHPRRI